MNKHKVIVRVLADHRTNGDIVPVRFKVPDHEAVNIDRAVNMGECPAHLAGGSGVKYHIRCEGREMTLFHGEDCIWFLEI